MEKDGPAGFFHHLQFFLTTLMYYLFFFQMKLYYIQWSFFSSRQSSIFLQKLCIEILHLLKHFEQEN